MRRILYFGVIAAVVAIVAACSTSSSSGTTYHVYIGGVIFTSAPGSSTAGYWKDGTFTSIGAPAGSNGGVMSLSGTNTYFAGHDQNGTPSYFVNGTPTNLTMPAGTTFNFSNGVLANGSTVYVVGQVNPTSGPSEPVLWTNGAPTVLPLPAGDTQAYMNGEVIAGGTLYVLGSTQGSPGHPIYWDSTGAVHVLPEGTGAGGWTNGVATNPSSIVAVGNDVYMAGTTYTNNNTGPGTPIVWKNGSILWTGATSSTSYQVSGMTVSGSDVYVCGDVDNGSGSPSSPVYWKNGGNAIALPTTGLTGTQFAPQYIAVAGSTIYITGKPAYKNNTDPLTPILWVVGSNPTMLTWPNSDPNASIQGITASGSDIWISGDSGTSNGSGGLNFSLPVHPIAWKNGTAQALNTQSDNLGYAGSIFSVAQ